MLVVIIHCGKYFLWLIDYIKENRYANHVVRRTMNKTDYNPLKSEGFLFSTLHFVMSSFPLYSKLRAHRIVKTSFISTECQLAMKSTYFIYLFICLTCTSSSNYFPNG